MVEMAAMGAGMVQQVQDLAIGKSMIDSSPLLQQMLKLMKFWIYAYTQTNR